jgi:uncharacterized phage protein (TIGR02220 family)
MYRKIECRIWADKKFLRWKPQTKLVFFYLLTGRHTHQIPGVIVGYRQEIEAAIKHADAIVDNTTDAIADAIRDIIADGCLMVCEVAPLMYLPNALKHNKPVSPGQVKSWAKSFNEVPDSPLKNVIFRDVNIILGPMSDGMRNAFADAIPDTETETETEVSNKEVLKKEVKKKKQKTRKRDAAEGKLAQACAHIVITHLAKTTGRDFQITQTDVKRFQRLIHEGHTKDRMIDVVNWACETWNGEWVDRITPKALFKIEKFEDHWQAARTRKPQADAPSMAELKPV